MSTFDVVWTRRGAVVRMRAGDRVLMYDPLRGAALYKMPWFDALIWAYADEHGLDPLWSEDFQDGRLYGRERVKNPFSMAVYEPSLRYGR
jgi:predicted nucleic acid-binding protein